ncbi:MULTISPECIES: hypothetical protein [Stenotrophomonas]|uniref:hypothetical protein n=1 Tax=Stenotrophomonas TaxID=40323 RepID=UPI00128EAD87|nr:MULTISPECIES: hypothetical protein [Stenotrophomonas]
MSRAIPGIDHFKRLNEERSRAFGDAPHRAGGGSGMPARRFPCPPALGGVRAVAAALARRWCLREAVARPDPSDVARAAGNAWHRLGGGRCRAIPGALMEVAATVHYRAKNAGRNRVERAARDR